MHKYIRFITTLSCFCVILSVFGCSSSKSPKNNVNSAEFIREHNLKSLPRFDIPIVINDRVIAWMDYFQGAGRKHFKRYLERSGRYVPLMRKILAEEGVPQDLIYISLIESGFNVHARSHANAVGPWQFIRSTGKRYGMRIDGWVDERRDPYLATHAAAQYYKYLYGEFGDWYLAMAGYNAGEGRVGRGLKKTGARDFWELAGHKRVLRAETRDYVPKFIAAAIIAKMPERFGFSGVELQDPFEFEIVEVETQTDLSVIAKCAGVEKTEIRDLNPHLHRGATPYRRKNYKVRVPVKTSKKFNLAYAKLPKSERIQIVRYRVKGGDTLSGIARRYGVSLHTLASANNIKSRSYRSLRKGKTLVIPLGSSAKARYAKQSPSRSGGGGGKKFVRHNVRSGETAGTIAEKYRVSTRDLKRWNNLNRRLTVRVGQKLKIYTRVASASGSRGSSSKGGSVTHKVLRGETVGLIAGRYGISTKNLMELNGIKDSRKVRAGKKLIIKKDERKSKKTTALRLADLPTSKKKSSSVVGYRVKRGETLGGIANRNGVTVKELMAWNGIKDVRSMRAGQKLAIRGESSKSSPSKKSVRPAKIHANVNGGITIYRVRSGDTLWDIARRHRVTIAQLQRWNSLDDPSSVRPGTKLKIHKD